MKSRMTLCGRTALALALTAALAAPAWAAGHDDDRGDASAVAVIDPAAKAVIGANLKARTQTMVVTRFSVAADAAARAPGVSSAGCPAAARANRPGEAAPATAALDPKILDAISARLSKRLARRVSVATQTTPEAAPQRAVVVTGCITRFEAGNAAKRWVGLHYGASRLAAHVRVGEKLGGGLKPVAEFDVAVTGGSLLPPLSPVGIAVHAATMSRQTLAADAAKLAARISYTIEDAFLPDRD